MKKLILLSSLSVLALLVFAGVASQSEVIGPIMEFDCGDTYDWGERPFSEEPISCTIKIFNRGNDTLKIDKVKPACGCTSSDLKKDIIAPGDSTTIDLKLNLKKHSYEVTKDVHFFTNVKGNEKQTLKLKVKVNTGFEIKPQHVIWMKPKVGEASPIQMTLMNTSDLPITIDSKQTLMGWVDLQGIEKGTVIAPHSEVKFDAICMPDSVGKFYVRAVVKVEEHPFVDEIQIWGWGVAEE